jgi:hypothetical protein
VGIVTVTWVGGRGGDLPLPTGQEALGEPFRTFPSWFMRVTCVRCGKERMLSETRAARGDMLIRDIIARMRHDGCGGRPGRVELVTSVDAGQQPASATDRHPPGLIAPFGVGHRYNMHRIDTAYAEWWFTAAATFGAKSCRAKGAAETDF